MCAGGAGRVPRRTDHDLARRGRVTGVRRSGSRYTDGRYRSWPMPTRPAGKSHARLPHTFTQTVVRSSSDSPRANLARTSRIGSAPIVRQPSNACRDCYNDTNTDEPDEQEAAHRIDNTPNGDKLERIFGGGGCSGRNAARHKRRRRSPEIRRCHSIRVSESSQTYPAEPSPCGWTRSDSARLTAT